MDLVISSHRRGAGRQPAGNAGRAPRAVTVLIDNPAAGWQLHGAGPCHALLARLRADSLDRRLAEGLAPESTRLLAIRAAQLTTPRARATIAASWEALARRTARRALVPRAKVPLDRQRIAAATDEIATLTALLRGAGIVNPAGVAAARRLLTRADSPAFRVRPDGDLIAAITRAVAAL